MRSSESTPQFYESPGYLVGRLENCLRTELDRALEAHKVTGKQLAILSLLDHMEESTPARLAELLHVDMGAVTRLLDRLENKRLVVRKRNPKDRRSVVVQMTGAGKSLQPQLSRTAEKVLEKMLKGIRPSELAGMSSVLKQMLSNLLS